MSKLLIIFSLFLISCSHSQVDKKECEQKRAAFDIGSGSTKMVVASVDVCKKSISKILLEEQRPITFKEALVKNKDNILNFKIQKSAIKALSELKKKAIQVGAVKFSGMATSAFRTAKNGQKALSNISKNTGIKLKVIDQKQEARLGYYGAVAKVGTSENDFIVWDIGGGSMQMTKNIDSKLHYYLGKMASVSFKEYFMQKTKNKNKKTPNPLRKRGANKAALLAKKFAEKDLKEFKKHIKHTTKVYGIGGVHYYSIRGQINSGKKIYTKEELQATLLKRSNYNDKMLKSKYAKTDVTNLALVLGHMNALKINEVEALKVNMAHGLLLSPQDWK